MPFDKFNSMNLDKIVEVVKIYTKCEHRLEKYPFNLDIPSIISIIKENIKF